VRLALAGLPPVTDAEIAAVVVVVTIVVAIGKVVEDDPCPTTTLAGTDALELLDPRLTVVPPCGALPFNVTVPVEGEPPSTVVGESVMALRVGGLIVSVAALLPVPAVAVIVTGVEAETGVVATVNVAVDDPAGTVTDCGTVALGLLELRATVRPPVPAATGKVTVPVEEIPPVTEAGDTAKF